MRLKAMKSKPKLVENIFWLYRLCIPRLDELFHLFRLKNWDCNLGKPKTTKTEPTSTKTKLNPDPEPKLQI